MKFSNFIAPVMAIVLLSGFTMFPQTTLAAECTGATIVSDTNTISGGEPAIVVSPISPYWTASIPGASWIWGNVPLNTQTDQTLTFTRTFSLTNAPESASLSIAADDLFTATINGTQVSSNSESDPFMSVYTVNVAPYLVSGENTITINATNLAFPKNNSPVKNPAGLLYSLTAQYSCGSTGNSGSGGGSVSGQFISQSAGATPSTTAQKITESITGGIHNSITTLTAPMGASKVYASSTMPLAAAVILFGKQLPLYFWIALVLLLLTIALLTNEIAFGDKKKGA